MPVRTAATIIINAPLEETFQAAISFDPRELIQSHGPLPGIDSVEGQTGAWTKVGETRQFIMTDKSKAHEQLITLTPGEAFAYKVTGFTGLFGALVDHAQGDWHFTRLESNKTQIDWTYDFYSTGPIAEPVLWFIVKLFWPGFLNAALGRVKERAE